MTSRRFQAPHLCRFLLLACLAMVGPVTHAQVESAKIVGFKQAVQAPFQLDVNQVVRVDLTLAVGNVNERVEVTAAEPLVESQTSSIGQVVEEQRVHELPLNGRNFVELAYLTPGVNQGPAGAVQQGGIPENQRGTGAIQANGLTATNNNFLLIILLLLYVHYTVMSRVSLFGSSFFNSQLNIQPTPYLSFSIPNFAPQN